MAATMYDTICDVARPSGRSNTDCRLSAMIAQEPAVTRKVRRVRQNETAFASAYHAAPNMTARMKRPRIPAVHSSSLCIAEERTSSRSTRAALRAGAAAQGRRDPPGQIPEPLPDVSEGCTQAVAGRPPGRAARGWDGIGRTCPLMRPLHSIPFGRGCGAVALDAPDLARGQVLPDALITDRPAAASADMERSYMVARSKALGHAGLSCAVDRRHNPIVPLPLLSLKPRVLP